MGRYRQNFSLYKRKSGKDGKEFYYFRTYTPDGKRTCGKSTGCVSITKARAFCEMLFKKGELYKGCNDKFGSFAEGFFDEGSEWTKDITKRKKISKGYIYNNKLKLKNYVMPYFKDFKLTSITLQSIEDFRDTLMEKNISNGTINAAITALKVVIQFALKKEIIEKDPFRNYTQLNDNENVRDAVTLEEVRILLKHEWRYKYFDVFLITAALTGMRISEILGVRRENVKEGYIDLRDQRLRGELCPLKNKKPRIVPICKELQELLESTDGIRKGEFAFPYQAPSISTEMKPVFTEIEGTRKDRMLTFHSIRHFFNTYMISKNINPIKIDAMVGHSKSQSAIQSRYTNFKKEDFAEILDEQTNLYSLLKE